MINFSEILGVEKSVELAVSEPEVAPASVVSSGFIGDRVDPEELEDTYKWDPLTFSSVNKSVQTIMAAGYEWRAKSQKVKDYFVKFFDNIGQVGEGMTFHEMLAVTFQNQMIYGKHYNEIVYNKKMTKIGDLYSLDPKQIDYARGSNNRVVLDKFGRPVGYTQTLPYGVDITGKGDEAPDTVSLKGQQIFLLPARIAHFKLFTYGDRLHSIGNIEPAYKSIIRRQKLEEANSNDIYAKSPVFDYVGDPDHQPTPDMIKNATLKLSQMQHKRYFAVPYWHKVLPLEGKQSEVVVNAMKYLRENACAALGMPLPFALGSGEATNRATLNNQQKFLEHSLRDTVKRTLSAWRRQVFKRISDLEGFDEVPELVWGDISAEDKEEKAKRLAAYTNNRVGILRPEDVRNYAIKSEGLDLYIKGFNGKKEKVEEKKKDEKLSIKKVKLEKNKSFTDEDLKEAIDYISLKRGD